MRQRHSVRAVAGRSAELCLCARKGQPIQQNKEDGLTVWSGQSGDDPACEHLVAAFAVCERST